MNTKTNKPRLPLRTLKIQIRADGKECFTWLPSRWHRCQFLAIGVGHLPMCGLFHCRLQHASEMSGALRCKACLDAET